MANKGVVIGGVATVIGFVLLMILLAVGVIPNPFKPTVATGPTGGQTTPNNPTPEEKVLTYNATDVIVPPLPKLVKYIKLSKVMTDESTVDFRSLQVAEVKAFVDGDVQLNQAAYSDVSYGAGLGAQARGQGAYPAMNINDGNLYTFTSTIGTETNGPVPIHTITMTIKDPVEIKRLEVYNRATFAPERLRDTFVTLLAEDGSTIWTSSKLTADTAVQVLNPQYSDGFTSAFGRFRR